MEDVWSQMLLRQPDEPIGHVVWGDVEASSETTGSGSASSQSCRARGEQRIGNGIFWAPSSVADSDRSSGSSCSSHRPRGATRSKRAPALDSAQQVEALPPGPVVRYAAKTAHTESCGYRDDGDSPSGLLAKSLEPEHQPLPSDDPNNVTLPPGPIPSTGTASSRWSRKSVALPPGPISGTTVASNAAVSHAAGQLCYTTAKKERPRPPKSKRVQAKHLAMQMFKAGWESAQNREDAEKEFFDETCNDQYTYEYGMKILRSLQTEADQLQARGEDPRRMLERCAKAVAVVESTADYIVESSGDPGSVFEEPAPIVEEMSVFPAVAEIVLPEAAGGGEAKATDARERRKLKQKKRGEAGGEHSGALRCTPSDASLASHTSASGVPSAQEVMPSFS